MSIASRLKLATIAWEGVRPQDRQDLVALASRGVDVMLLDDIDSDRELLTAMREIPALVGCRDLSTTHDLCVVAEPGPALSAYAQRQRWGLQGIEINDAQTLATLPTTFDFVVLRRRDLIAQALELHPPLDIAAIPWFMAGDFDAASLIPLIEAGVRRVWLTAPTTPEQVSKMKELLRQSWNSDPAASSYRRAALLS